jgi:hypothetical protein
MIMAYQKTTSLMSSLPTAYNRPAAMAGLSISSLPKQMLVVGGALAAYLLYRRMRRRS